MMVVAVAAMAVISLVPGAGQLYSSLPMVILWGAVAVSGTWLILRRKLWRRASVFTLHAAFIVILAGAFITWLTGSSETVHMRTGSRVDIGRNRIELIGFTVNYYPGTQAPADFVSTLRTDTGRVFTVSMNKVGHLPGGYRLFQSAYDPDGLGTVLTVSRDPWGTAVSYAGYALLAVSMLWNLAASGRRCRRAAALLLLTLIPSLMHAAPRALPADVAAHLGDLYVYRGGRIMPLSTLAHDFTLKVTGSTSCGGLSPEQVLSGWLFFYDDWKSQPVIKVKGEGRIALSDFFNSDGSYRFDDAAHSDANERFSLVSEASAGSLWKVFPAADSAGVVWYSPVDRFPAETDVDEWHFMRHSFNYLAELAAEGRWDDLTAAIDKIGAYQRLKAADVLPSRHRVRAEQAFVTLSAMPWAATALLAAGIILFIWPMRRTAAAALMAGLLWTATLIALSWAAAGSVPLTDGSQAMLWVALCALVAELVVGRRTPEFRAVALVAGALALCVALMGHRQPQITQSVPVLRSPLLSLHVLAVTSAYALMALMALSGAAWLLGRRTMLPLAHRMLRPAVFLMAAGIFIGAVWANQSWGRYWGWDPKEVWALITMLVYCLPLHRTSLPRLSRPRAFAWYCVAAFAAVLVTYFGVNFILGGLHSYA